MEGDIHFSPREKQVMGLLAEGLSGKQIAYELNIKMGTVRNYLSTLYDKLKLPNMTALAIWAIENREKWDKS